MKGIKGQLSSLSFPDLMQWIELNKKSGLLLIKRDNNRRCFCFKGGGILFASFSEDNKRFSDYLIKDTHIDINKIKSALSISRQKGVSFIKYLIDDKLITMDFMRVILQEVAESVIMDVLSWEDGLFQFIETLPLIVDSSPIRLNTSHLVFESVRKYDESLKGAKYPQGPFTGNSLS